MITIESKKKKLNLIDKAKAKIGRWYKIWKPLSKVAFRTTLEGKNTNFVIKESKKESRKFFQAQVYSLPKLVNRIRAESDAALQKDELRELLETLPLLLLNIVMTKEKWYIGKIENHPFDIFIAPERFVEVNGKNVNIYRGLHIQTKRLFQYPPKRLTLNEWLNVLRTTIEEKIAPVDFGFNGHIHFYNHIPLNESVDIGKLKKLLKKLFVPYNKFVDSMSLSMELVNQKNETTVITWYFYPLVYAAVGVLDLDLERVKKIYLESDIFQMLTKAITAKNI